LCRWASPYTKRAHEMFHSAYQMHPGRCIRSGETGVRQRPLATQPTSAVPLPSREAELLLFPVADMLLTVCVSTIPVIVNYSRTTSQGLEGSFTGPTSADTSSLHGAYCCIEQRERSIRSDLPPPRQDRRCSWLIFDGGGSVQKTIPNESGPGRPLRRKSNRAVRMSRTSSKK
jgi:hypothetical protein